MGEIGDLEISERMSERADIIDNATYQYVADLLELNEDEAEKRFPWDIKILREIFDSTVSILQEYNHAVCNPYVAISENGRQYRCTLSECCCNVCNYQDEFMEKERLLSNIENAIAIDGLPVEDGGNGRIIVRNSKLAMDFEIRISELPDRGLRYGEK